MLLQRVETRPQHFARHDLAPIWPGIDVTVATRLVAQPPNVDLQHVQTRRRERSQSVLPQRRVEPRQRIAPFEDSHLFARIGQRVSLSQ